MGSRRRRGGDDGPRDTAKDIILGTNPSGQQARRPKEGKVVQPPPVQPVQPIRQPPSPARNGIDPNTANEIGRLNGQLHAVQRQNAEQLANEQAARRRLEDQLRQNQDQLNRVMMQPRSAGDSHKSDVEDMRRRFAGLEASVLRMQQDILHIKAMVDRHSNDLMVLNNELKNRPTVDPGTQTNQQMLDGRTRELHGQVMQLRQLLDKELSERKQGDQTQVTAIQRLQAILQDQDARKNNILQELARKGDMDAAKLNEENKRLNDKIEYITNEVTKNMMSSERQLRDEMDGKYSALERAVKGEVDARLQHEKDVREILDERWHQLAEDVNDLKAVHASDKSKNRDRFQKINEALAVLERHLETGNKKIDRAFRAEVENRKLHEKGLLAKLTDLEDRLAAYMAGMSHAVENVRKGKETEVPEIDFDGMRREMEAISADKHKMTMEGMLKLEEKMGRIEKGLDRDTKELKYKMENASRSGGGGGGGGDGLDSETLGRLRAQLRRLDEMQEDIGKQHEKLKDKVERQIPEDLDELAQKLENSRRQLNDRVDREENERYLAIREMQEEVSKLRRNPPAVAAGAGKGGAVPAELQRDVDECKIAIKKLAESVTTVKNVLDRKLNDEIRTRERDVSKVSQAVEAFKSK